MMTHYRVPTCAALPAAAAARAVHAAGHGGLSHRGGSGGQVQVACCR